MNTPELELFCRLEVDLAPIRELGSGRAGQRRIIPIIGGRASGPYVTGRILNLGADWQTVFADGVAELDTRSKPIGAIRLRLKTLAIATVPPKSSQHWRVAKTSIPRTITCAHMPF